MSNFEYEGFSDYEWDDRGELAWNEFDWERYLREQDGSLKTYLRHYEKLRSNPERIDEVARLMGWNHESWTSEEGWDEDPADSDRTLEDYSELDPYTLHKNPIYIATRALYLSLRKVWEHIAANPVKSGIPQRPAVTYLASLHDGELDALQAIQALDIGDYALAVSFLKRALTAVNNSMAILVDSKSNDPNALSNRYHDIALPRLFDLREIWLRVMRECREELSRRFDGEDTA